MSERNSSAGKKPFNANISYIILLFFSTLVIGLTFFLYKETQKLFQERLQERLTSIAQTASIKFDATELSLISGRESIGTSMYEKIVKDLNEIRDANTDIRFIYILRKTENPNILHFVADADSINPDAEIDLNNDGVVTEDDELAAPGDEYDISEYPHLKQAFIQSTVDPKLTVDQWGTFLSASAPIYNEEKVAQEMIGIDVDVSNFQRIINLAAVPYALFVIFLLLTLVSLTLALVKIWNSRVEFLNELDHQKDELLSIVSHQLATPITSLKWYVEMLLDGDMGKLTKEQDEQIRSMQSISADLSDLVGMILDVSRIQLGKIRIDKQKMDLNEFFKEILQVIEPKAKEKQQKFDVELPANLPVAMLDKRYTRMTIENLLSNAVKYTPEKGSVQMKVELHGNTLSVTVKDTGVGIPKEDQAKIFGKLYRASNVRNSVDGNGFGLYVAKGAVEAQGGTITFKSEIGKGTTFFVELPIA